MFEIFICIIVIIIIFLYQQKQFLDFTHKIYKENYMLKETFLEKIVKVEESQTKIDCLCNNILSLQNILNDKKNRGYFGEIILNDIIYDVFGNNKNIYDIQHVLPNKNRVDVIIFNKNGNIPIDSKFPLENYKRIIDNTIVDGVKKDFIKSFKQDIKKHINDISSKYIFEPYTTMYAILFVPSESVFSKIHEFGDLIKYAYQKRICITSPSTIIALLSTLKFLNFKNKIDIDFLLLNKINDDFNESNNNLSKIIKNIDTIYNNLKKTQNKNNIIVSNFQKLINIENNLEDIDKENVK